MTITTMAYEDGAGIDFPTLRAERRARVLAALAEHDIDVLMLGRQGNARYVAGHRPLWRAVVTGWGPVCVLVREDDAVHLLVTTWDDGVPPDIPHERLSGLVWNPELIRANVARIDGLSTARRIAVDGMSASMAALLRELAPNAELVDGEALMRPLRAAKLPGEIDCIRTAIALAEGALYETAELVAPAVREADLKGVFHAALTRNGLNRAASEGTFCATPRHRDGDGSAEVPLRLRPSARTLVAGELVALSGAAHHAGYEGAVARTRPVTGPAGSGPTAGQRALYRRWRAAYDALERACRPGATVADLAAAWASTGEPLPPLPVAFGVGFGVEPPLLAGSRGPEPVEAPITAGTVLVLQPYVWEAGVGGYLAAETVLVDDDGPRRLTRLSHYPFDDE